MPKGWIKGRARGTCWNKGLRVSVEARLEHHSQPEPNSGCILWLGMLNWAGYGLLNVQGKQKRVHRLAWELVNGQIPKHLQLDHLCRIRSCINPRHLELVTPEENTRRGVTFNSLKTHCKYGHELVGHNLIRRKDGRECRKCHNRASDESFRRRSVGLDKAKCL